MSEDEGGGGSVAERLWQSPWGEVVACLPGSGGNGDTLV